MSRSRPRPTPCLPLALLALLAPATAEATVALRLDDATQAARSDLVVVARVRGQEVERGADGLPYTHTTLVVQRTLKGEAQVGQAVVVRQMGGTLDGRTLQIPGDAHFERGERVVVFLADREPGSGVFFLTAMGQSKLRVVESEGGDLLLQRELGGLMLLDEAHRPVRPEPRITLRALRRAISGPSADAPAAKGVQP